MLAALPTLYYCEATGAFHVTNKGHEPMPQVLQLDQASSPQPIKETFDPIMPEEGEVLLAAKLTAFNSKGRRSLVFSTDVSMLKISDADRIKLLAGEMQPKDLDNWSDRDDFLQFYLEQ